MLTTIRQLAHDLGKPAGAEGVGGVDVQDVLSHACNGGSYHVAKLCFAGGGLPCKLQQAAFKHTAPQQIVNACATCREQADMLLQLATQGQG